MNNIIKRNNLKVNKVTINKDVTTIDTPLGLFDIKKYKDPSIFDYLLSRGFIYIPKIIDYDDEYILYEHINPVNYDLSEKAQDYIKLLSVLHLKTTYFKEFNDNEYKLLYDRLKSKINDLNTYYLTLTNSIEEKEYMSPSEYLLIKNISIINSALNYINYELDNWFESNNKNNKKRVVTLYNNIDINNMIKSKDITCLNDFSNTSTDSPIYDLLKFYNKYYDTYDFPSLLKIYEKNYKLLDSEKQLLNILISIPDKIIFNNDLSSIKNIKKSIDKIYITLEVLNSEKEKSSKTHENKNN